MNNNENRNEKKNTVVEAMLRARERELRQMGEEDDDQPGLTPEEHEAMYRRIMERLEAEGLMKDGTEEGTSEASAFTSAGEKAADHEERKGTAGNGRNRKTRIRRFRRRAARAACVCLVAGAAVFALSMTGEANRLLLMQTVNTVLGTGDLMQMNNDDDRALSAGSEDEARQKIETALQAEVPDFLYLPEGMTYQSYELGEEIGLATIEYQYEGGILYLNISNSVFDMSQGNIKENSEEHTEKIETLSGTLDVVIKRTDENKNQYEATWKYKNIVYSLNGEMGKDEIIKIIENISYSM